MGNTPAEEYALLSSQLDAELFAAGEHPGGAQSLVDKMRCLSKARDALARRVRKAECALERRQRSNARGRGPIKPGHEACGECGVKPAQFTFIIQQRYHMCPEHADYWEAQWRKSHYTLTVERVPYKVEDGDS